ncbi:RluA family pseudouridine synthase [Labilibacter sediminis]|nr:RluA family pseudouridine synthase [Labilibacter sediminis]
MNNPSKKIESYIVPPLSNRVRLSDFAPGIFKSLVSKKATKNAIKKGLVWVNGKKGYTGDFILGGETVDLYQAKEDSSKPSIQLDINVYFEDDYLAIVNKPAGVVVSGNKRLTLENALPSVLNKSSQPDALNRPEPIHRLDFPTSGALLIGKTQSMVIALNKLFETREIDKRYLAITIGKQKPEGIINEDIDQKASKSEYSVIKSVPSDRFNYLNLVQLNPHSGRRHQLRKHLLFIGNPILGDAVYYIEDKILKGKGLYLHSHSLKFLHPVTKENIHCIVPPPSKFHKLFPDI